MFRTHFNQELLNNKVVRFIYQGQFLKDTNTISSYNIRDQTTIHCHITTRQGTSASNEDTNTANVTTIEANNNQSQVDQTVLAANNSISTDRNNNNNNQTTTTTTTTTTTHVLSIEFGNYLIPIFTILLASIWYFRMNFKQFFSPLSNLFLFVLTFVYTVFLFLHFYQMFTFTHRFSARARRVTH